MYFVNVKYMLSKTEIFSDTNQLKYCDRNESFPETNTNLTPKYVLHICVSSMGINHPSGSALGLQLIIETPFQL